MKIHYCGDMVPGMLKGWPVCGSGDFAYRVVENGNQSSDLEDVTCQRCLNKIPRCPDCGYSEHDSNIHLDHDRCKNKNPPWLAMRYYLNEQRQSEPVDKQP